MAGKPFTDEEQDRLRQLHADGLSRNAIADVMDRPKVTISRWASRLGLSFDREAVRAATDARQVDLKDRRQRIQEQLLDLAERTIERTHSRYLLTGFSHTGEMTAEWLQQPPAKETKDLTTAAMSALARFDAKAKDDASSDTDKAKAALGSLGKALSDLYGSADDYRDPGAD
ncbi:hypothetical protein [Streptomyces milbemycinicus]|uniref:hypothetical protein n=1 Tax=Streptomyces milbemycinicus TaxID=476552 RepID=UPI0033DFCCFF